MTITEAADYLRPIMESASLPKLQAALRLALEALEGREVPTLQGDKKLGRGQRLTYQLGEYWQIAGAGGAPCDVVCDSRGLSGCHDCPIQTAFDRLAAYEDTMPFERTQELAQAEKDGRLVVLPCKAGDTVYVTYGDSYRPFVVDRIHILANCEVQMRMRTSVIETLWLSASNFGKTVFLTREEAEAALKKREEADNEAD